MEVVDGYIIYNCTKCKKNIPEQYYIIDKLICQCCDEILKGGTRTCIECNQIVNVPLMERPYLRRCKSCAAKATKERQFRGSKIMITCECGSTIKK